MPANRVATAPGTFTRHFPLSVADGPGGYIFSLLAVDAQGSYAAPPDQEISVLP